MSISKEDVVLLGEKAFTLGYDFWNNQDKEKALDLFLMSALLGNQSGQVNLGFFFDQGIGTNIDKGKALYWYKKAYRNGEESVACNIALLYEDIGNINQARYWFQKSLQADDGDALYEIGKRYFFGSHVYKKNYLKAKKYLEMAINSGNITEDSRDLAKGLIK